LAVPGLHHLVHAVGDALFRAEFLDARREAGDVAMAAGDGNEVPGGPHVGAGNETTVDGAHQRDIRKARQGAHVTDCGEARQQRALGVYDAAYPPVGGRFVHRNGDPVVAGEPVAVDVGMHVQQPGQQGVVAEFDKLCVSRQIGRVYRLD
jgi:hypothetical protein